MLAYILKFSVGFVLVSYNQIAVVSQALGYFFAHMFASIFPLWRPGSLFGSAKFNKIYRTYIT